MERYGFIASSLASVVPPDAEAEESPAEKREAALAQMKVCVVLSSFIIWMLETMSFRRLCTCHK